MNFQNGHNKACIIETGGVVGANPQKVASYSYRVFLFVKCKVTLNARINVF